MNFSFQIPTKVIFGRGTIKELPNNLKNLGEKAFIVSSLKGVRLLDDFIKILKESNVKFYLFLDVKPNPDSTLIDEASKIFKKKNCDYLIGIGGGSSIDFAKGVAVAASHNKSIVKYLAATKERLEITKATYPIIAIPTTFGSGSELTLAAVITNPDTYEKTWIGSIYIYPKVSIIDPILSITLPKKITAATGIDALSHAIEAYISTAGNPFGDILAENAIKIIARYLPEVVANGNNIVARENMAWASVLAGIAINHNPIGLSHGMGHALGGRFNIEHGIAIALCLQATIKYSWTGNIEKFAKLAQFLGEDASNANLKNAAKSSYVAIEKLLKEIDLDLRLSDFGIKENMIDKLVEDLFGYLVGNILVNPKIPSKEDIKTIYTSIL